MAEALRGDAPLELPCGQCVACRLNRSRMWATRCMHEADMHEKNCFITLTYEKVPENGSLDVTDFQSFIRRLRKKYHGKKIRYFHCGEYGDRLGRPHYHGLLFGFDFDDKVLFKETAGGRLYFSQSLRDLWGKGHCLVGDVSFESAAYVARYVLKKVTGADAEPHYRGLAPEYVTMSRRPGIGKSWLEKFGAEVYPSDEVIVRGVACKPPRYYDNWLEGKDEKLWRKVKEARGKDLKKTLACARFGVTTIVEDNSVFRQKVKEKVALARVARLARSLEAEI